jgi:hypothetical protein
MPFLDLTGRQFGSLKAIHPTDTRSRGQVVWMCKCRCGNSALVPSYKLTSAHTKSCGCYRSDLATAKNTTHGDYRSPEHRSWQSMKSRCLNPKSTQYKWYGGRGISVCDKWLTYEGFLADMGRKPAGYELDRIDNNGHYEPANCRWASHRDQSRNKSDNVMITWRGQTRCMSDWAESLGVDNAALWARVRKLGWSWDRALSEPIHK